MTKKDLRLIVENRGVDMYLDLLSKIKGTIEGYADGIQVIRAWR